MKQKYLIITLILFSAGQSLQGQKMNNETLEKIIYVASDTMRGEAGLWEFFINDIPMMCITDQHFNRMRIISPVKDMTDVTSEEIEAAMSANFHSALDVRYAVSEGVMWVAFIHPLKELSKDQVLDALSQVYSATVTFGSEYTSTELVFPGSESEEPKPEKKY